MTGAVTVGIHEEAAREVTIAVRSGFLDTIAIAPAPHPAAFVGLRGIARYGVTIRAAGAFSSVDEHVAFRRLESDSAVTTR